MSIFTDDRLRASILGRLNAWEEAQKGALPIIAVDEKLRRARVDEAQYMAHCAAIYASLSPTEKV